MAPSEGFLDYELVEVEVVDVFDGVFHFVPLVSWMVLETLEQDVEPVVLLGSRPPLETVHIPRQVRCMDSPPRPQPRFEVAPHAVDALRMHGNRGFSDILLSHPLSFIVLDIGMEVSHLLETKIRS